MPYPHKPVLIYLRCGVGRKLHRWQSLSRHMPEPLHSLYHREQLPKLFTDGDIGCGRSPQEIKAFRDLLEDLHSLRLIWGRIKHSQSHVVLLSNAIPEKRPFSCGYRAVFGSVLLRSFLVSCGSHTDLSRCNLQWDQPFREWTHNSIE